MVARVRNPALRALAPQLLDLVGEVNRMRQTLLDVMSDERSVDRAEADRWLLAIERARAELLRALAGRKAADREGISTIAWLRGADPHVHDALTAAIVALVGDPHSIGGPTPGEQLGLGAPLEAFGAARPRAGREGRARP